MASKLMCYECSEVIEQGEEFVKYDGKIFCCEDCRNDYVDTDTYWGIAE